MTESEEALALKVSQKAEEIPVPHGALELPCHEVLFSGWYFASASHHRHSDGDGYACVAALGPYPGSCKIEELHDFVLGKSLLWQARPVSRRGARRGAAVAPLCLLPVAITSSMGDMQALSVEEARERQNKLAKMRALLFYHELKAKRMKKIKSKARSPACICAHML